MNHRVWRSAEDASRVNGRGPGRAMLRAPMRILHLLASPWWSGPAENVALLALAQRALGHEVTVACDRLRTDLASEEPLPPRLEALGLLDAGGLELSVKSSPLATWRDARRLRGRAVDVVHSHFSHDHVVARLGTPRGAVLVRSIHAPRSLRRFGPGADAWTVPSDELLDRLRGQYVGILPALVDPAFRPASDRAALRSELGLEGALVVGMVSTFQASRRHDVAVEAFAALSAQRPGARLVLVGDGGLVDDVRSRVKHAGLESRVTFAGYRSGPEFVRWLQALDVVWILGLGNDWSARAAAQATACGVRVVSVDLGALPRHADAVVGLEPAAIAQATVEVAPAARAAWSNERIARDVLRLYERAGR